ncbi:hypothetical protein GCM10025795_29840 [Verticiella sediminum]
MVASKLRLQAEVTHFRLYLFEEQDMKKAWLAMMVCMSALVAGCNTMEGAGKDIQAGGQAIENSAERAK